MAYPRFRRARTHKFATRTTGNLSITSSSGWADATTALDLVLEAQVGDVIEYGINALWGAEAIGGNLDVATVVSGTVTNHFLSGGLVGSEGASGWVGNVSALTGAGGSIMYSVVAGDLANGTVTLRLRAKVSPAGSKTLYAIAAEPLQVWAKNLGPQDPN